MKLTTCARSTRFTLAVQPSTTKCEVWEKTGDALQLINTRTRRDHFQVVALLELGPFFPDAQSFRWDHNGVSRAVLHGERRREFLDAVHRGLGQVAIEGAEDVRQCPD
eukprot:6996068-Pyramimonas_sp.AAC.1